MPRKKVGSPQSAPDSRKRGTGKGSVQPGRKVPPEDVPLIIASEEPASVWAERYGCSESVICEYRRKAGIQRTGGRKKSPATEDANDLARGQTLEKILANCEEDGECRVWTGYYHHRYTETPLLSHKRVMYRVREVVAHLTDHPKAGRTGKWSVCCETPGCVAEKHLVFRTPAQHAKHASKSVAKASIKLRNMKMAQANRRKIPLEAVPLIQASKEPLKVLAERYQCSEGLISRYRRKQHAAAPASPWAGL